MSRVRLAAPLAAPVAVFAASAALLAAVGAPAPQPPSAPPGGVPFQSFGGGDGFYRSAVGRRADQFAQELTEARAALRAAPVAPDLRRALLARIDRTVNATEELGRVARRNGDRRQLARAFDAVETEAAGLTEAVRRADGVGRLFGRATYAYQQLAAAVEEPDQNPARVRRGVVRLAAGFAEEADDLLDAAERHLPGGVPRDLERALKRAERSAQRLSLNLEESGDLAAAGRDLRAVSTAWADALALFGRVPALPAPVQAEATRADGLYRRLAARLGAANPNPGPLPPGPLPGPVVPPVLPPARTPTVAVGASDGGGPRVVVYTDLRSPPALNFFAYDPQFRGGVRVAAADVNGDGVADVVTGPGNGMPPLVRVFDGRDGGLLAEFPGHDPGWTGGINVAASGLLPDGRSLVAVGPQTGGAPIVKVFDLVAGKEVSSFPAYPARLRGGARVAWVDLDGNGTPNLVTAPGECDHRPVVRVFDALGRKVVAEFEAYDPTWRRGVWVAGYGRLVVCGPDGGSIPVVRAFDPRRPARPAFEALAFPEEFRGGARVGAADVNADGTLDVLVTPGTGIPDTPLVVLDGRTWREMARLPAFPGFDGGGFVSGK